MIGSGLLANFGPGFLVAKTHKGCPFMVMVAFQFFALYIYIYVETYHRSKGLNHQNIQNMHQVESVHPPPKKSHKYWLSARSGFRHMTG